MCAIASGATQRDLGGFVAGVGLFGEGAAAEHERDDAALDVLVDAGQTFDVHRDAGLFFDLTAHAVFEGLVEFEHTSGRLPMAVIAAADHQHLPGVVDDDPGDADGV